MIRFALPHRSIAILRDRLRQVTFVAIVSLSGCAGGTAAAPVVLHCAQPNVAARLVTAAVPVDPPIAVQEGVYGKVNVLVGLDATSKVVSTEVVSSPSSLLNAAALTAARNSTFATQIAGCVALASNLIFTADFEPVGAPFPAPEP